MMGSHHVADAEWYAAGYGGWSSPQSLQDVKMDALGERLAAGRFGNPNSVQATIQQSFSSSPVSLKSSPLFGGKGGYFFSDEGFNWLGVEVEAFTTKPSIKSQTVSTAQSILYTPTPPIDCISGGPTGNQCPQQIQTTSQLQLQQSSMRLITVAFNVVVRYPGKVFQPYVGVGAGAFYFSSSGQVDGRQLVPGVNLSAGLKLLVTEEWGLFIEGKYNRATFTNLDPSGLGLSGQYSAFNAVAGLAYHF
jgi:opacity protein-like surface antigen